MLMIPRNQWRNSSHREFIFSFATYAISFFNQINGVIGILTYNKQGWVDAIKKLAGDNKLRSSMGKAGRRRCVEHFTLQAVFQKMLTALEQGIANRQNGI